MGFPLSVQEHFLLFWEQDRMPFDLLGRKEHLMAWIELLCQEPGSPWKGTVSRRASE